MTTTSFADYDALGRPGTSSQQTPTCTTYTFNYEYQPAGLNKVEYPVSGRVVSYSYDPAVSPLQRLGRPVRHDDELCCLEKRGVQ